MISVYLEENLSHIAVLSEKDVKVNGQLIKSCKVVWCRDFIWFRT